MISGTELRMSVGKSSVPDGIRTIRDRLASAVLLLSLLVAGCASPPLFVEDHRLARYRPDVAGVVIPEQRTPLLKPVERTTPRHKTATIKLGKPVRTPEKPVGLPAKAKKAEKPDPGQRLVQRGDELRIYLTGIPNPEEIVDVVDDLGRVNLPLIGGVSVEGKTTSKAEDLITRAYVRGGYYKKINIIVVPQMEEYFVQGEVRRQNKYFLSGDLTLLQAISEAGGYTPFANRKKIKVIRSGNVSFYNGKKIEQGKVDDPIIQAGDIIVVSRRWY